MALNCERRQDGMTAGREQGEPCGECPSCERIWSGSATLDVVEIDAASNRGVDDARDLRERAMYAASQEGRHKVYIIDEAHMLTREAWNALLKILEEPPPDVVFVFATTEPQKIASTAAPVLSRLQRFDFRRIGPTAIRNRLRQVLELEQLGAEEDALAVIARYADGGMRDALSVLDQVLSFGAAPVTAAGVREVLGLISDEQYAEVLRAIAERDTAAVFPLVERLVDAGADLAEFMNGTVDLLRAVLMVEAGSEPGGLTETQRAAIAAARGKLAPGDVVRMLGLLADAEAGIRRSASARLIVETLLLRWTVMDRIVDLERVLKREGGSEKGSQTAGRPDGKTAGETAGRQVGKTAGNSVDQSGSPAVLPSSRPAVQGSDLASLRAAWPEIVEQARERSRMVGEALESASPASWDGASLELEPTSGQEFLIESALARQGALVVEILASRLGSRPAVKIAKGSGMNDDKSLSHTDLRISELERIRRLDKALDVAATELDLEIVDDRLPRSPKGS